MSEFLVPSSVSACFLSSFQCANCRFLFLVVWCVMIAYTRFCRNSFLRSGQTLYSSMNLMRHYCRDIPILDDKIVNPPWFKEMFVFLLYECVHSVHLLSLLLMLRVQLPQWKSDLVLNPRNIRIVLK